MKRRTTSRATIQEDARLLPKRKQKVSSKAPAVYYSAPMIKNLLAPVPPEERSLFESLSEKTRETLRGELGAESDSIVIKYVNSKGEGINPTAAQMKLIHCVYKLLRQQSPEIRDHKKPDFYKGSDREKITLLIDSERIEFESVHLYVSKYDLAKMYNDGEAPSGVLEQRIDKLLDELDSDKNSFFLSFPADVQSDGKDRSSVSYATMYGRLLTREKRKDIVVKGSTGKVIRKREGYILKLHPLWTQWLLGFVLIREDALQLLQQEQTADTLLHLYLARAHSYKPKDWETLADEYKLFSQIFQNEFKSSRWKLMSKKMEKAIEACIRSKVLLSAERRVGAESQAQWVFRLNPDYLWDLAAELPE